MEKEGKEEIDNVQLKGSRWKSYMTERKKERNEEGREGGRSREGNTEIDRRKSISNRSSREGGLEKTKQQEKKIKGLKG